MSALFDSPDPPKPATPIAPPPAPTLDDAKVKQQSNDDIARRRGRAAAILTGPSGDLTTPPTKQTTLG